MSATAPYRRIAIIGLGLIGGSIARRIRHFYPAISLIGMDSDPETVALALREKCIDQGVGQLEALPDDVELVWVCTPIAEIAPTIRALAQRMPASTVFTDVGSVKGSVLKEVADISGLLFIPGHPMAGREVTGFGASSASLLDHSAYILVPQAQAFYAPFKQFLTALQCRVVEVSAEDHDRLVAVSSHLPFLAAQLVLAASGAYASDEAALRQLVSSGFRDTTRVGGSDPKWGVAVCEANLPAIREAVSHLKTELDGMLRLLDSGDFRELETWFSRNRQWRSVLF